MLLIDVGNSRIKAACSSNLEQSWAVTYQHGDRIAAIDLLLAQCKGQPGRVVLNCVNDQQSADYVQRCSQQIWGLDVDRLIATDRFSGLVNGYAESGQLGVDRWCGLVAAWHQLQAPVIVVGCGTAITIDSVDKAGRHLGGVIFPGIRLAEESFYGRTGNVQMESPVKRLIYADSTAAAVASGVRWAVTGGINEQIKQLFVELGGVSSVWLTGGDAAELKPYIDAETQILESLVFQGMVLLAE